ncbi:MAG: hypothetical protein SFV52_05875 [Saprospiraceae bacterium]|nr:hypothetical protein [Saprospiraceae bacterium]
MHDIEPHFRWRDLYTAEADTRSPFYGRAYSEFEFSNMLYNFYIHPQWDAFGSATLYAKILFADYEDGYACIELIGEWNDALYNDIMFFKREIVDVLMEAGIYKFILFCDNVLNFYASDDDYYAEWYEEASEYGGWIVLVNTREHVDEELELARLQQYLTFGEPYKAVNWRPHKPQVVLEMVDLLRMGVTPQIGG